MKYVLPVVWQLVGERSERPPGGGVGGRIKSLSFDDHAFAIPLVTVYFIPRKEFGVFFYYPYPSLAFALETLSVRPFQPVLVIHVVGGCREGKSREREQASKQITSFMYRGYIMIKHATEARK